MRPIREQRQPDWSSWVDKVACENNELDHADCSSQRGLAWPTVVWIILILGVAAYGAAVVRNVTEMLTGIAVRSAAVDPIQPPSR